jgi:hypothetical protein
MLIILSILPDYPLMFRLRQFPLFLEVEMSSWLLKLGQEKLELSVCQFYRFDLLTKVSLNQLRQ